MRQYYDVQVVIDYGITRCSFSVVSVAVFLRRLSECQWRFLTRLWWMMRLFQIIIRPTTDALELRVAARQGPLPVRDRLLDHAPLLGHGKAFQLSTFKTRSRSRDRRRNKRSRSSSRDRRRRRSRTRSISRSRSRDRGRHGRRRSKSRSPMSNRKRHLAPRENPPTSRCLGVFGLSLYTTERDLHQLFSRYGKVDDVQLVYDHPSGRSRGFGFVYFDTVDDAVLARERAAGTEIDGHRIRIDFSITKRPHTPTPVAAVTEMIIIVEGRHRRTIIVDVHVRTPTVLDCCIEKTLSEVIEAVMVEGAFGSCALTDLESSVYVEFSKCFYKAWHLFKTCPCSESLKIFISKFFIVFQEVLCTVPSKLSSNICENQYLSGRVLNEPEMDCSKIVVTVYTTVVQYCTDIAYHKSQDRIVRLDKAANSRDKPLLALKVIYCNSEIVTFFDWKYLH
ncbi:splicing factor, arginine/serine-rich 10 [Trichinella spiralis]|uniref:splicing factor, arginine/serine-rich 10 n=1 Tax=Trichinella spiralis TaxID=6334 RepID=UPI0001EFC635|nr:splicing factor, arginine/serine-rich 10 [Trichinella spiralis]